MKIIRIPNKRRKFIAAEWNDIRKIVAEHLIEYKTFYDELAEM